MVWRVPKNHYDDCCFCIVSIKGINCKLKSNWTYPDLESARRPVPSFRSGIHSASKLHLNDSDIFLEAEVISSDSDFEGISPMVLQCFDQFELNDQIRDLELASRLNNKNLLHPRNKIAYYRNREQSLLPYFSHENSLVWCNDVGDLLGEMWILEYRPNEWSLVIDSSTRSLICVLLHNGNNYASILIGSSTSMKEEYRPIKLVLEKLKFHVHQFVICVDLKMVNFLLRQQSDFTKYPGFLCLWDSRTRNDHWTRKDWPLRENMVVGKINFINKPLMTNWEKMILPPLHIKLGLMK
ncbi:hypothetical protein LOD99_13294 [Oopsacas minuta]|uniref:Uncharacterized protein n=1 Tax=Oopsacas minuta TaxID=111878 RepID=A0AAV7KJ18_9METZ|nr:hypothetical protein LOD99_13294 [Oopsacas minuta]